MSAPPGAARRGPVLDTVLLTVGALLAALAAVVFVAQYRPVLFVHDTEFIGLSLALLAGFATVVGFRVGRRVARDEARLLPAAAFLGAVVAGLATAVCISAVVWYRVQDGIGWPRVQLGALVVLVGGLAFAGVLVGSWCGRWWAPVAWLVGGGLFFGALVVAALASWVLENDFSDRRADQCVVRGTVTYCHYPGYGPFVDEWARVVDAVFAGAPTEAIGRPLRVHQTTPPRRSYSSRIRPAGAGVAPLLAWSPGDTAPFALAIDTANWVTGRVLVPEHDSTQPQVIDAGGRGVVAFWLAAQATDRTRRGFEYFFYDDPCGDAVSGNEYVDVVLPGTGGPNGSDRYAAALLRDPDAPRKVREHWAELTDPATTSIAAGLILGIEPVAEQPKGC